MMVDLIRGRRLGEGREHRGWVVCVWPGPYTAVLPRQLTHHLQQSLVLLFELLILIFNVIQVLQEGKTNILGVITFWKNLIA